MKPGEIINDDNIIRHILISARTIAVVGLSPKPERDSNKVAVYLKDHGYKVIPVRPAQKEILEEKTYPSLDDIDESIDIINVFRNPAQVMPHAQEALRIKPKLFWMQLGVENPEAAELLAKAGIDIVMNRCIMVEHDRLCR
ncbi:MAG: CoA-binding protein [Candidatus Desulfaltia sp.]|nr:CoA-binding protein [Candidatus Desulfaltia sp.]